MSTIIKQSYNYLSYSANMPSFIGAVRALENFLVGLTYIDANDVVNDWIEISYGLCEQDRNENNPDQLMYWNYESNRLENAVIDEHYKSGLRILKGDSIPTLVSGKNIKETTYRLYANVWFKETSISSVSRGVVTAMFIENVIDNIANKAIMKDISLLSYSTTLQKDSRVHDGVNDGILPDYETIVIALLEFDVKQGLDCINKKLPLPLPNCISYPNLDVC